LPVATAVRCKAFAVTFSGPFHFLERLNGFADIGERGGGVPVERIRVDHPHPERETVTLAKNPSRHGQCSAQHRLGFFEALEYNKGRCVVAAYSERFYMFLAIELHTSRVYVSLYPRCLY